MSPPIASRPTLLRVLSVLLGCVVILGGTYGFRSLHRAPAWVMMKLKLKLGLEQDASAGMAYDRTLTAPLPLAIVVKEFREEWPSENVASIHFAAREVGTALLQRGDIEVGEIVNGKFVPSNLARWDVNQRMTEELKKSSSFFENTQIYVFRRR